MLIVASTYKNHTKLKIFWLNILLKIKQNKAKLCIKRISEFCDHGQIIIVTFLQLASKSHLIVRMYSIPNGIIILFLFGFAQI